MMIARPESVGMCSQRLARVDRFLADKYITPCKLPCALLQVAREGPVDERGGLPRSPASQSRSLNAPRPAWPERLPREYEGTSHLPATVSKHQD